MSNFNIYAGDNAPVTVKRPDKNVPDRRIWIRMRSKFLFMRKALYQDQMESGESSSALTTTVRYTLIALYAPQKENNEADNG
jgi:hypothetical protein